MTRAGCLLVHVAVAVGVGSAWLGFGVPPVTAATVGGRGGPVQLWSGHEVNAVTVGVRDADWLIRDDGPKPLKVRRPCRPVASENAALCPTRHRVEWARFTLSSWDSLRKQPDLHGLHVRVEVEGTRATVDVRDGQVDEVVCQYPADVVADPIDRVWGGCDVLNGIPWQRDTVIDTAPLEMDVLDGQIAWTRADGRLRLRNGDGTRDITPFGGHRRVQRVTLGRDARGRAIAVFLACRGHGCSRWYAMRLADGHVRRVRPTALSGCTVRSLAVWRRALTTAQRCGLPGGGSVDRVVREAGGRILMRRKMPPRSASAIWPVRVRVRGAFIAYYNGNDVWLLQTGPHPCRRHVSDSADAPDWSFYSEQPLLAGDDLVWPTVSDGWTGGLGFHGSWVTMARVASGCRLVRPERYAILGRAAFAAAPVGGRLYYLAFPIWDLSAAPVALRERALATVGPPIEPYLSWAHAVGALRRMTIGASR